jgi:hypothetical protein
MAIVISGSAVKASAIVGLDATATEINNALDGMAQGDIVYASDADTPAQLTKGADDYVLTMNGNVPNWEEAGSDMSWNDGTATRISGSSASIASFGTVMSDAAVKSGGIYKNPQTITRNETIGASDNAMSAGYLIIDSGVTVVVEEGARWVII